MEKQIIYYYFNITREISQNFPLHQTISVDVFHLVISSSAYMLKETE